MRTSHRLHIALLALALAVPALAQTPADRPTPRALAAAQQAAMAKLAFMDGAWRGEARQVDPDGTEHRVVQTERIGTLLGGTIRLIEGRGYNADGSTGFNAFAVLSWDVQKQAYAFRSHAMGAYGEFAFRPTRDGYVWEIPAGPMTLRYTATIQGNDWHEVGDRIAADGTRTRFFDMRLKRIGDSDWPAGNGVLPR